jgi:hypothetical protein
VSGLCEICGEQAALDRHHRKRRSQGGDDSPANIMEICRMCHNVIHADPAWAYDQGYLVKSWEDPASVPVERKTDQLVFEPAPGQECPTCYRRVPHKQKKTSPKTDVLSYRAPVGEKETTFEVLEAAARHAGLYETPHWQWKTYLKGLVALLQLTEEEAR